MNNSNLVQEFTIIETWDREIIEINISIENWILWKIKAKNNWEDWIFLKNLKRFLKFSNIKDEKWKTKYLNLEEWKTKKEKRLTKEEMTILKENIKNIMEKTFEWRKKNFIERRKNILNNLWKEEIHFWLKTTNSKLLEYESLRLKKLKGKESIKSI